MWRCFLLSLCYLGATVQLRNIQSSHPSPRHSCTASPWLLHNVQLWSTAVCWETSVPLLLQNPLITWFCLRIAAFNIPAMWTKEKKKQNKGNTQTLSKWHKEIQSQEMHSPPTLPQAHSGLCCMQTRMDEPVALSYHQLWQRHGILTVSHCFPFSSHCLCRSSHCGVPKQYLECLR